MGPVQPSIRLAQVEATWFPIWPYIHACCWANRTNVECVLVGDASSARAIKNLKPWAQDLQMRFLQNGVNQRWITRNKNHLRPCDICVCVCFMFYLFLWPHVQRQLTVKHWGSIWMPCVKYIWRLVGTMYNVKGNEQNRPASECVSSFGSLHFIIMCRLGERTQVLLRVVPTYPKLITKPLHNVARL